MQTMQTKHSERRMIALALTVGVWTALAISVSIDGYTQAAATAANLTPEALPAPVPVRAEPNYDEVLWLARCIYSETKRPDEQELVAWVVRNRVETRYRGKSDYRSAVLDPYQFSAFNHGNPKRDYLLSLSLNSTPRGFQEALRIAWKVMNAEASERPFSRRTRHFYSARSMQDGQVPHWAVDVHPISLDRPVDPRRFRFYDRVA